MIFFFFQNKSQGIYFALFSIRTYLGKKDHQLFHEQPMNQNGYRKSASLLQTSVIRTDVLCNLDRATPPSNQKGVDLSVDLR